MMKNKLKSRYERVSDIVNGLNSYLEFVDAFENECAYTDGIIDKCSKMLLNVNLEIENELERSKT